MRGRCGLRVVGEATPTSQCSTRLLVLWGMSGSLNVPCIGGFLGVRLLLFASVVAELGFSWLIVESRPLFQDRFECQTPVDERASGVGSGGWKTGEWMLGIEVVGAAPRPSLRSSRPPVFGARVCDAKVTKCNETNA